MRPWSLEIYRLAKFLALIQKQFFQYPSRLCAYLWGINSLKNNSAVSRSGYLYGVNQKFSLGNAFFVIIKSITRSFKLNSMMKNENERFANISIRFLALFIMKLIAQINIFLFPKLKILVWNISIKEIIHFYQNLH